mmetsp:Transcript_29347/g.71530  ORF Transcript_29347/g.71530 Transcript_29347/m.71530 type:complete len:300 (-) Transcript_29347:284-1183(-)
MFSFGSSSSSRRATHAGGWYTDDGNELRKQLEEYLSEAKFVTKKGPCRGIIAPHAGFSYSGPTAAHAYKNMDQKSIKRVFILGPSHHYYTDGCEVSACKSYQTPIGDMKIDAAVNEELMKTGKFKKMKLSVDEDEHSIEMHLPYIKKMMGDKEFTIVPILVGSLSTKAEQVYGEIFSEYLNDPANFFVISSDFCHWGSRFRYTWYDKSAGEVWESIKKLDHMGMKMIENLDAPGFASYLKEYRNTICGRHPIGVYLNALRVLKKEPTLEFVKYSQSNKCRSGRDSSVSYASAICHYCKE